MPGVTSFSEYKTLGLIHFQNFSKGGKAETRGQMLPFPPERRPFVTCIQYCNSVNAYVHNSLSGIKALNCKINICKGY